jgi:Lysylphosphatidylglycerol synthase TM region
MANYSSRADEAEPHKGMQGEDQPAIAARSGASLADPEPLPSDVSPDRLRRGLLRLGGLVAIAVAVLTLAPGLGELRSRFAHARPVWIGIACALEVLSVLAYVPAFRAVFCTWTSWATSYKIAVAEEGAGSLFPLGGAGSLALGVWALRRGGMPADEIARKTVAFFLLTSAVPVAMLFMLGVGLATGVLPGGGGVLLTALPAVIAAGAIAATLALRRLARGAETRIRRQGEGSRWARVAPALSATSDGIDEALHQLRRAHPLLLVGLVGFLVFDLLTFWASFRAVGASPELALIWMAYLIGQLGNWLPVRGGIGGTELGLRRSARPIRVARPHRDRSGPALPRDRTMDSRRPRHRRVRAATAAAKARDRGNQAVQAGRHHRDRRPRPRDHRSDGGEIDRDRHARTRGLGRR